MSLELFEHAQRIPSWVYSCKNAEPLGRKIIRAHTETQTHSQTRDEHDIKCPELCTGWFHFFIFHSNITHARCARIVSLLVLLSIESPAWDAYVQTCDECDTARTQCQWQWSQFRYLIFFGFWFFFVWLPIFMGSSLLWTVSFSSIRWMFRSFNHTIQNHSSEKMSHHCYSQILFTNVCYLLLGRCE